jgi:threonine 3-dehydrogenase
VHVTAVNGREVFATWYRTRWLLEHGVVDLRPLITHTYGLAEFERAFAELESGDACKIILEPVALETSATDTYQEVAAP